jgi:hypothetical protein
MAEYSVYNPQSGAASMRQQGLQRLALLAQRRQEFANEQYKKQLADEQLARQKAAAAQKEAGSNWLNMAGTGAMIGSFGGPVGAGIGAALGAGVGIYGSMKQGNSFGHAVTHPMGDKFDGMADIPILQAASAAGNLQGPQAQPIAGGGDLGAMSPDDINAMNMQFAGDRFARSGTTGYMSTDNPFGSAYRPAPAPAAPGMGGAYRGPR